MSAGEPAQRGARDGAEALRCGAGSARPAAGRRGVRAPLTGYAPAVLPTCAAVLRPSAREEIVHGIPRYRALAGGVLSLDFGAELGGRLAARGEHRALPTGDGRQTPTSVRGSDGSIGGIET